MFGPKSIEKLPTTSRDVYRNKLVLDDLALLEPFEMADLDGLKVLKHPEFEEFHLVIQSLRVTDDNGRYMPRQTQDLQRDIVKMSKQQTFLELLYNVQIPDQEIFFETLKEKLMINLVNLVLEPEIPTNRNLSGPEIFQIKETFKQMLASA